MISSYRAKCKCVDDEFYMILMASTIVQSLDENQSVTARETFNFTKLSELDTEHFQDNHCIGKFQVFCIISLYDSSNKTQHVYTINNFIQFILDVIGIVAKSGTLDCFINQENVEELYLDFQITDNMYAT